jgi:hypothetical protein
MISAVLLVAMISAMIVLVTVTIVSGQGSDHRFLILFAFFYLASILLHILVHELGHAVFGRLSGYTLMGISVLSLWILKTDTGRKMRYFPIKGAGGATISVPKDGYKDDTPYTMMTMGGIFMNVVTTAVFVVVAVIGISVTVSFFAWIAVIVGVYTVLTSLIPMSFWMVTNDAALLGLFKKDDATKHCMYFLQMRTFETISGIKSETPVPADLPYGNRLADMVRLTVAEMHLERRRLNDAEHILHDLLDNTERESFMYNIASLRLLFVYAVRGADRETVDAVCDEKMMKFVKSLAKMDTQAILFLIVYEKLFNTGAVRTEPLVKRFDKMIGKIRTDTSLERNLMESLR